MKNIDLKVVIPDVIKLYNNQEMAPASPGLIASNGSYQFCAGACLAYIGLKSKYGTERALLFANSNCSNNSSDAIIDAFEEIGWDISIAKDVILKNDSYDITVRKKKVLIDFNSLFIN